MTLAVFLATKLIHPPGKLVGVSPDYLFSAILRFINRNSPANSGSSDNLMPSQRSWPSPNGPTDRLHDSNNPSAASGVSLPNIQS